jgi:hypothetical protein
VCGEHRAVMCNAPVRCGVRRVWTCHPSGDVEERLFGAA